MHKIPDNKLLIQLFNFQYGGIVNIHICKNKKGFLVVSKGFEIIKGQIILNKKAYVRKLNSDLQSAILVFCYLCKKICEDYGFFKENYFQSEAFKHDTLLDVY